MRALVTGATGFIGNFVVQELHKQGHQVIATSRNSEKARMCIWFSQVKYIPFDINETKKNIFKFFDKPDIVIHLAWEGLPNYDDEIHFERNLFVNYRFLKNLLENGLKNLTVAGTCLEYGFQNGCLLEETPTLPVIPYGLAKDTLRKSLEQLQKKHNFYFKWLRLFYTYGEGQNEKALFQQLEKALQAGDASFNMSAGEQLRDYLPVEKIAENIVRIARQNVVTGIINCCSGTPISVRKLVETFLAQKQKSIHLNLGHYPYANYEPMAFWGNIDKLQKIINADL